MHGNPPAECVDDHTAIAYAAGEGEASHRERIERHLDACRECRALISLLATGAEGQPPDRIAGRYDVLSPLGAGAMGVVVRAYDPTLDRVIAVKLLRAQDDLAARARMVAEAQAMARIADPHVITVYDAGVLGDEVFIAMEFVDGSSLRRWLTDAPRTPREILDVFRQIGRGLAAAHRAGLVHRDVKPENVLIGRDGRARVGDFGLARAHPLAERDRHAGGSGTPAYMAPEQLAGAPATAASDQFGFCVALWEAFVGERPFVGADLERLARAVRAGPPRALPRALPRAVCRAVRRGLATRPEDRFPSMDALVQALAPPPRYRLVGLAVIAIGAAVVAGGVVRGDAARVDADPCTRLADGAARLVGPERRAALRAGLETGGGGFGADAWATTDRTLAGWAPRWAAARVGACRDAQRDSPDARAARRRERCLDRQLDDALIVVDALARGGRAAALRTTELRGLLAADPTCAEDIDGDDGPQAAHDGALRAAISAAKGEWLQGNLRAARLILERAQLAAGPLRTPRLEAELLLRLAQAEWAETNAEAVEPRLRAAVAAAEAAGADRLKVQAMVQLATVLADGPRVSEALGWADQASATVTRLGGDARLAAEVEVTRALLRVRLDPQALGDLAAAVSAAEATLAPDDELLPTAILALALARHQAGDTAGALADAVRGAAATEHVFGPRHPSTAEALNFPGGMLVELGRYEDAQPILSRAVEICVEAPCGDDATILALKNLATNELRRGALAASLDHLRHAHRLADGGRVAAEVRGELLAEEGEVLIALRRWTEALTVLDLARTALAGEPAADVEILIDAHLDAATALTEVGRRRDAAGARAAARAVAAQATLDSDTRARVQARLAARAPRDR